VTVVVAIFASTTTAWADRADVDQKASPTGDAELWRGRLVSANGTPSKGSVVAYLRPQPDKLAELSAASSVSPNEQQLMVLLATEDTDASGKFVLRGDFDSTLDYMRDASGALSLMIVASSPGTFAISTDTVWWENGAWTSIDPAIGATTEKAMLAQASVSEDEGAVLPSSERPFDIVMQSAPAGGTAATKAQARERAVSWSKTGSTTALAAIDSPFPWDPTGVFPYGPVWVARRTTFPMRKRPSVRT